MGGGWAISSADEAEPIVLNTDTHNTPKLANTGRTNTPQYGIVKDFLPIVGNRWDDGRYLGCNTVHRSKYDHHSHNPTNLAPPQQCGAVLQLLVNDLGARFDGFWSHSMNIKFKTTPSVTTGQAAAIARECGGQPHQAGNDRLAAAIESATVDIDADAAYAERRVREHFHNVTVEVVRARRTSRFDGRTELTWRVSITSEDICIFGADMCVLNEAIGDSIRRFRVQMVVNAHMREIDAADKATSGIFAEDAVDPRNAGGAA